MAGDLSAALDVLCPMHLRLDGSGHIRHAGPTLHRLLAAPLEGARFLEAFECLRPRDIAGMQALREVAGQKLRLRLRGRTRTPVTGVLMPLADGGALVNLGFGISVVEAVRAHTLTNADFAPTDLAVEMLFLVEAKSTAMEALKQMSFRFNGARVAAARGVQKATAEPGRSHALDGRGRREAVAA